MRRWQSTPVPQRFTGPSLKTPWTLESMIDAFRNGDDLLGYERLSECVGRLSFDSYGGTDCMRAVVESFGHWLTAEADA